MSKIPTEKYLTRKEMHSVSVTRWIKVKGFKLSLVSITEPTFETNLNLVLGEWDEFKRYMLQVHQYIATAQNPDALHFAIDGVQYVLLNPRINFTAKDYGLMAHELHHFVHHALRTRGMEYSSEGEEAFAYMQGYYMEMICRACVVLRKTVKA